MKITFSHNGDSSVGIPGESVTLSVEGMDWDSFADSAPEAKEFLSEFIAKNVGWALRELWQFPVDARCGDLPESGG